MDVIIYEGRRPLFAGTATLTGEELKRMVKNELKLSNFHHLMLLYLFTYTGDHTSMLLSDKRIVEEMKNSNIIIEPFDQRHLGTNSYDCRLGEWYFQGDANIEVMHLDIPAEIRSYWGEARKAQGSKIAIRPGTTILAHTQEIIGGHNGYLAKMYSRSTVARSGLSVCRCAGVGDVGYISRWTMEISNHTQTTILVPVGFRICQLTFEYVGETLKEYHGKYGKVDSQWTPEDMLPKPQFDWDYDVYRSDRGSSTLDEQELNG